MYLHVPFLHFSTPLSPDVIMPVDDTRTGYPMGAMMQGRPHETHAVESVGNVVIHTMAFPGKPVHVAACPSVPGMNHEVESGISQPVVRLVFDPRGTSMQTRKDVLPALHFQG